MNTGDDYVRKPDSVGPPVPVCEVRVVDASGADVPTGDTVGELLIKGPNVVRGYWNKPGGDCGCASRTGGCGRAIVARLDDEGFVYIVDRAKDMVIRGGENVYSVEVEAAIYEHPAVARRGGDRRARTRCSARRSGPSSCCVDGARLDADELRGFLDREDRGVQDPFAHLVPRRAAPSQSRRARC